MHEKLRVICPLAIVLLVLLICGYLNISSLAVTGKESNTAAATLDSAAVDTELPDTTEETITYRPAHPVVEEEDPYEELLNNEGFYETGKLGYDLTEDERRIVECAVMCEAGGEGLRGQMMVAQSIMDGAIRNNFNIMESIKAYSVATTSHSRVTEEVQDAVARVFDQGQRVTMEKTDLWYNPAIVMSLWHEEQQYVITVGSHRFFWMNGDM